MAIHTEQYKKKPLRFRKPRAYRAWCEMMRVLRQRKEDYEKANIPRDQHQYCVAGWFQFRNFYEEMGEPEKERYLYCPPNSQYNKTNCSWEIKPRNLKRGTKMKKKPAVKLNLTKAIRIVELMEEGYSPTAIAEKYSISRNTVYQVHRGEIYKEAQAARAKTKLPARKKKMKTTVKKRNLLG